MKTLTALCFLIMVSLLLKGQQLEGEWQGTLNGGASQLRLVFHITRTNDGYESTVDSPDQNVSGIHVTRTNFNYPKVKFEISTIGALFEGEITANEITGKWMQSGRSLLLVLQRIKRE
jgi:hypothetical protein